MKKGSEGNDPAHQISQQSSCFACARISVVNLIQICVVIPSRLQTGSLQPTGLGAMGDNRLSIVITTAYDQDAVFFDLIDDPVFFVNAA